MKFNRKSMTFGLVGLGIVGILVTGGVVAAQSATGDRAIPRPMSTTSSTVGAHQSDHMDGMSTGQNSPMTAVASYLGLSKTKLQDKMHSGKSLANVAEAQNKSVSGLKDAMIAACTAELDSNSTLTSDQKVAAVEKMRSRIDTMVKANHTKDMGTDMGTDMGKDMGTGMGTGMGTDMGVGSGSGADSGMHA
jgi:hypothetical protein